MSRKEELHKIIFGTESDGGKRFDVILIGVILLSVFVLMLDSIKTISERYGEMIYAIEWMFTLIFTLEYGVRIYCSPRPWRYITSFYGIIDLLSVLPTYLTLLVTGTNFLLFIRLIRVLRVFRVFKLVRYLSEANILMRAMFQSRRKVLVFFFCVLVLSTVFGSLMYAVEGPGNGFTSIPKGIYWTIVTITTVGYGDITPQTAFGQVIAALAMLTGYSIIAVPTGIFTAELAQQIQQDKLRHTCGSCFRTGHDADAIHCKYCGVFLKRLGLS